MFEINKEYKRRSEIHDIYGGQQQGGISTPKNHPVIFIFIFTSDAGEEFGYRDQYREDGIFEYTGEGQRGDMTMTAGNKAILDHQNKNKTLHVFETSRR